MDSQSPKLPQQISGPFVDGECRRPDNFSKQQPSSSRRSACLLPNTFPSLKARRSTSPSSSSPSSPSSSSSADSLTLTPFDFKRSSVRRHQGRPVRFPLPPGPCKSGKQIDDAWASVTEISPLMTESLKLCAYQTPPVGRSADPRASTFSREGSVTAAPKPWDTGGMRMHHEYVPKQDDAVLQKNNRRRLAWRTACAMAHAYIHQIEASRHEDAQTELTNLCRKHDGQRPEPPGNFHLLPAISSTNGTSKDEVGNLYVRSANDAICIDEVVNPTQAAEWFGVLFLSTSALVS